ncbi:hypothetical protein [Zoogloea sp.]|jgi:ElaB/YqjD/DUF883 family membrane-anchored ribosome-binding protein|uniref:DUF883 family protein n=1 Tax=Zoogloea sp. TaxID=49181 RepID=UPI0011D5420D|nr:hypothetical protein [Zoogloea sp.]MBK6653545.1 DUF883 family protein [Zoogloea sp.]MBK7847704.1 DUF883 family protein [Zoogloea sp.]TXG96216.1 MAG: DUF883 family protein [Zoogloea sp.]HPI59721.1 hypothetical protein [Zoogloea sp.]
MNDFKGIVGSADALLTDMGKATTEGLADARSAAGSALCDARDSVTRQARHSADATDHFVREHPWQVLAGAAVLGFVTGFMLNRR